MNDFKWQIERMMREIPEFKSINKDGHYLTYSKYTAMVARFMGFKVKFNYTAASSWSITRRERR